MKTGEQEAARGAGDSFFLKLLLIFLLFYVILNISWILFNTNIITAEEIVHYSQTLLLGERLDAGDSSFFRALLATNRYHPPAVYYYALSLYRITAKNPVAFKFLQFPFWIILPVSVYFLTLRLYNPETALAASVLICLNSLYLFTARHFYVDFPLAVWVFAALAAFLKSSNFSDWKWSIVTGILCGAGIMTKWTFPVFFVPPALVIMILGIPAENPIRNIEKFNKKSILKLLAFLFIILLISGPWYLFNLGDMAGHIKTAGLDAAVEENDPPVLGFASLAYYLWSFKAYGCFLLFVMGIMATLAVFIKKHFTPANLAMLAGFLIPLVFFTLLRNKDARYIMPAYMPFIVLASSFIMGIRKPWASFLFWFAVIFNVLRSALFFFPAVSHSKMIQDFSIGYSVPPISCLKDERLISPGALGVADFFPRRIHFFEMPPCGNNLENEVRTALKLMESHEPVAEFEEEDEPLEIEIGFFLRAHDPDYLDFFLARAVPVYARLAHMETGYRIKERIEDFEDPDYLILRSDENGEKILEKQGFKTVYRGKKWKDGKILLLMRFPDKEEDDDN